ncbi:Gfo/Idh/MocA family protein [Flammeovirga agarivorans]|uniref:Gfo/Idh/MocA family oxidoreductase n=1 Tax=Flammeovirga agarivorans TaxID=2726742 RepID=A0A7X8SHV2_9BACT|nr:Gfo/Idh/MocA family oxidoreductase [Flammeovirga agarivorans]NLR90506.1 Gfo/Idh/MocA family oxidoreductase [Flammeovirga agarivorans]
MKNKKINFAIIGCGRIAQRHAEHINNVGELWGVCDIDENKSRSLAEKYNCKSFNSIEELLTNNNNIDVVAICSPNGLHAEHTIKSLNAGYHVLCEKPMAINLNDCGEMIKASERSNKRLFIVKQNRYNPPVSEIKKLIDNDVFGKIFSIQLSCFWNRNENYYKDSWKGTKSIDGGTLYTQFSHFIDLLYWMFGDVKKTYGFTKNYNHHNIIEFEDSGVISLLFYSGAIGTINYSVNTTNKNMEGSLTIIGEKGTVKIGGQYLNELEYQQFSNGFTIKNLPKGNPPNSYGEYKGSMSNHDKVYENIIDVLNNNGKISTIGFEGLKTVEIIEEFYNNAIKL